MRPFEAESIDALFIDGDHTYAGVQSDINVRSARFCASLPLNITYHWLVSQTFLVHRINEFPDPSVIVALYDKM